MLRGLLDSQERRMTWHLFGGFVIFSFICCSNSSHWFRVLQGLVRSCGFCVPSKSSWSVWCQPYCTTVEARNVYSASAKSKLMVTTTCNRQLLFGQSLTHDWSIWPNHHQQWANQRSARATPMMSSRRRYHGLYDVSCLHLLLCCNGPYAAVKHRTNVTLRQYVPPGNNNAVTLPHFKQCLTLML